MKSKKPPMTNAAPDNFQTPASALEPLLPYLDKRWTIWEPSSGKGNIVRALSAAGFSVVAGDREVGFLNARPGHFDAIVGNPPYSIKDEFLGRCYDLGKPFALLMPLTTFDSRARQKLFHGHGVQVIFMPKRVNFETPSGKGSGSWFMTAWFCWKLDLPGQLVFTGFDQERCLMSVA